MIKFGLDIYSSFIVVVRQIDAQALQLTQRFGVQQFLGFV
jgi:hypothetical protein